MNYGIFLLLGANQGDPRENVALATQKIALQTGNILNASSVYRTAAWGMEQQPDFYNQVVEIASPLSPEILLQTLIGIETDMGRIRKEKWGPRVIDIDILFYGQQVCDTPSLRLPHPGIPQRRFTLLPLAEIAPGLVHPVSGKTITMLLAECEDTLLVEKIPD